MGLKRAVIIAGCSYATGFTSESNDPLFWRQVAYGTHIANRLNTDVLWGAKSGASNDLIVSMAIANCHRALLNYKPEEIVLFVGWTQQSRIEVFHNKRHDLTSWNAATGRGPNGLILDDAAQWFDIGFGYYKFLCAYDRLHAKCQQLGIEVIDTMSLHVYKAYMPCSKQVSKMQEYTSIPNNVIEEFVVDTITHQRVEALIKSLTFNQFAHRMGMIDNTMHPRPEAHKKWAEYILDSNKERIL